MNKIIIAAVLALLPIPASAQSITKEELLLRAKICLGLSKGEITGQQVSTQLKLDTPRKQRDFAVQCKMFFLGAEIMSGQKT